MLPLGEKSLEDFLMDSDEYLESKYCNLGPLAQTPTPETSLPDGVPSLASCMASPSCTGLVDSAGENLLMPNRPLPPFPTSFLSSSGFMAVPMLPMYEACRNVPSGSSYQCTNVLPLASGYPYINASCITGNNRNRCDSDISRTRTAWTSLQNGGRSRPLEGVTAPKEACLRAESHVATERIRRRKITGMLDMRKYTLPGAYHCKMDKAAIVSEAISYLKALQEQVKKLAERKQELVQEVGDSCSNGRPMKNDLSAMHKLIVNDMKVEEFPPPQGSASSFTYIDVTGTHASVTLRRERCEKGFLSRMVAALECSKLNVRHASVSVRGGGAIYMLRAEAIDGCEDAVEGSIRSTLEKIINDHTLKLSN